MVLFFIQAQHQEKWEPVFPSRSPEEQMVRAGQSLCGSPNGSKPLRNQKDLDRIGVSAKHETIQVLIFRSCCLPEETFWILCQTLAVTSCTAGQP